MKTPGVGLEAVPCYRRICVVQRRVPSRPDDAVPEVRLFSRGAVGPQLLERNSSQPVGQKLKVRRQPAEAGGTLEAALIHVERAVELDLDGVQACGRVAVMLGDAAAGVGLVAAHCV